MLLWKITNRGSKILRDMRIKLFTLLYETGPSAQGFYPGLGRNDPRVSRTKDAAEDAGFLNIADRLDLEDDPDRDDRTGFPEEQLMNSKITP